MSAPWKIVNTQPILIRAACPSLKIIISYKASVSPSFHHMDKARELHMNGQKENQQIE